MGTVNVGIGHDNNFVIPEFIRVEIFFADAYAQCRDNGFYFSIRCPNTMCADGVVSPGANASSVEK